MGVNPRPLWEQTTMEGMASVWGYQESVEDLKHKLFCTTLELESLRTNAEAEMRRSEESINQLILLLKITGQERDEARDQLQILLSKLTQPSTTDPCPAVQFVQPESPPVRPPRGNSSITESNSLSGTPKHQSIVSSPVESFFDAAAVSSPELSNINVTDTPLFIESNNINPNVAKIHSSIQSCDQASAVIDSLARKKALPEKGKLLQAVMEAGPLLDTLLLAGPLPRWRNPPPLQAYQIPPVGTKGHVGQKLNQATALVAPSQLAQCLPTPMLNFSAAPSLCLKRVPMSSVGGYPKRQKSQ